MHCGVGCAAQTAPAHAAPLGSDPHQSAIEPLAAFSPLPSPPWPSPAHSQSLGRTLVPAASPPELCPRGTPLWPAVRWLECGHWGSLHCPGPPPQRECAPSRPLSDHGPSPPRAAAASSCWSSSPERTRGGLGRYHHRLVAYRGASRDRWPIWESWHTGLGEEAGDGRCQPACAWRRGSAPDQGLS